MSKLKSKKQQVVLHRDDMPWTTSGLREAIHFFAGLNHTVAEDWAERDASPVIEFAGMQLQLNLSHPEYKLSVMLGEKYSEREATAYDYRFFQVRKFLAKHWARLLQDELVKKVESGTGIATCLVMALAMSKMTAVEREGKLRFATFDLEEIIAAALAFNEQLEKGEDQESEVAAAGQAG